MWTHFWDMHSGGTRKLKVGHVFIEASRESAVKVFYAMFARNPYRVTCTCCGPDYSVSEYDTVEEATKFTHELLGHKFSELALIVYKSKFPKDWRNAEIPEEGYVWVE